MPQNFKAFFRFIDFLFEHFSFVKIETSLMLQSRPLPASTSSRGCCITSNSWTNSCLVLLNSSIEKHETGGPRVHERTATNKRNTIKAKMKYTNNFCSGVMQYQPQKCIVLCLNSKVSSHFINNRMFHEVGTF